MRPIRTTPRFGDTATGAELLNGGPAGFYIFNGESWEPVRLQDRLRHFVIFSLGEIFREVRDGE